MSKYTRFAAAFPIGSAVKVVGPFPKRDAEYRERWTGHIGTVLESLEPGWVYVSFGPGSHYELHFRPAELERGCIEWIPE